MEKHIIIKLFVVFITVYCIDGGRSIMYFNNDIEILISQSPTKDLDLPHQHQLTHFNEDVKWLKSFEFDFSCFNFKPLKFNFTHDIDTREFSTLIWQPPKFV